MLRVTLPCTAQNKSQLDKYKSHWTKKSRDNKKVADKKVADKKVANEHTQVHFAW
jgi:hypothetical protein